MPLLIKNGKIFTVTNGVIEDGCVLIENGRIKEVGKNIQCAGAEVIDAKGCIVTPGFIDAHSHLTVMNDIDTLPGSHMDGNEMTDPITPHVRAMDAIHPQSATIPLVRSAGYTSACVLPGSANLIGGTGVCIKLAGNTVEEMAYPVSQPMKMALGENPISVYGPGKKMPSTRMGNAATLREPLYKAREYANKKENANGDATKMPPFDLRMESLQKVVKGEQRCRIHCHRADDITTAIRIAKEFNLDFILEHVTEGYKVKELLKANNVTCVLGPLIMGKYKQEIWDQKLDNSAILNEAGIKFCLTEDTSLGMEHLPMHIGLLIKRGLPQDAALKAVTINAAEVLSISDRVGSIEVGKDADLAIFDGNPFSNLTTCLKTLINGMVYENKDLGYKK